MGLNFVIYEVMKSMVIPATKISKQTTSSSSAANKGLDFQELLQKFVCGGIAGGVSKLAIYPLDTIKKRLQVQGMYTSIEGMEFIPRYHGIINCFQKVVADEGIAGLYKV